MASSLAIVTGAARGIGLAIATRLLHDGHRVVLVDQLADALTEAAAGLAEVAKPDDVIPVTADVSRLADLDRVIETATGAGPLRILVNNAGIQRDGTLEQLTEQDWAEVIDVDLLAAARLTSRAFPALKAHGQGRIVNISSIFALGNFGQANYAAAKSGLIGLTKTLALEGARHGVTANVICPGAIDTPGTAGFRDRAPRVFDKFLRAVPMRRLGEPRDIANAVSFYCSPDSGYITGQVLFVAGGLDIGVARELI